MLKIVLMVDDDLDDREVFQEAIHKVYPSVEVIFANNGEEALTLLSANKSHPDVIFLDYNMPRITGIQCLRALKANKKTRAIPVIMYTTSGDREQEKVALLLGADHYMKKTISFDDLCIEIQRLLAIVDRQTEQPGEFNRGHHDKL
jgi:CheY-like chemotaxis protein